MDHAGAASTTAKSSSSAAAVPDRALLTDIEAAIERCTDSSSGGGGNDDDRHVHEILFLVSNARGAITFLSRRITARLEAARAPAAALRSLLLVHRLLRAGDRYFEQDFRSLWASRELRVDAPRCSCSPLAAGVGYASGACAFVHGYSAYLEGRMQWVINQAGNLEPARKPPPDHDAGKPMPSSSSDDAGAETLLFKLAMCQRLLDLAIQLLPDNNTSASTAARSAFGIVLRESFKVYDAFAEGIDVMLLLSKSLDGLSKPSRVTAHEILKKACAQTLELAQGVLPQVQEEQREQQEHRVPSRQGRHASAGRRDGDGAGAGADPGGRWLPGRGRGQTSSRGDRRWWFAVCAQDGDDDQHGVGRVRR